MRRNAYGICFEGIEVPAWRLPTNFFSAMRTFIAIEIPDDIKKKLSETQQRLKEPGVEASWTRPEGIHLTLKFLGEIPETRIPDIMNGIRQSVEGRGPFRLVAGGVGSFPNPRNARVVWVGLSGDTDKLVWIQAALEEAIAHLGMDREKREFKPHLTLARIKYIRFRDKWLKSLEEIKDLNLGGFDVSAISLMRSELKRTGAVYTEIGSVVLK